MKRHLVRENLRTGQRITHIKTVCGKTRHITNDTFYTYDKDRVTCKICNPLVYIMH